jgi:hypothetical protein
LRTLGRGRFFPTTTACRGAGRRREQHERRPADAERNRAEVDAVVGLHDAGATGVAGAVSSSSGWASSRAPTCANSTTRSCTRTRPWTPRARRRPRTTASARDVRVRMLEDVVLLEDARVQ